MSPELKVLEKIRKVLIADATVKACFEDRVYTAHISSIDRPKYPAMSLHLMDSKAADYAPDMATMAVQIDLWMPDKLHSVDDVLTLYARVRALLHRQDLTDTTIGVTVGWIAEAATGPVTFDETNNCRHLPARYRIVAI